MELLADFVDLLVFPPDERYVVSSRDLLRALKNRPSSKAQLIGVAMDFTTEARELIASLGGLYFCERNVLMWTDECWHAIHQTKAR
jgi:hypothetical protein